MSTPQIAIIDTGSAFMRLGLAGYDAPQCTFSCEVGRPTKHAVTDSGKVYVAEELEQRRGQGHMLVNSPVKRGQIASYVDCKELWAYGFQEELRLDPGDCVVVTGIRPKHSAQERKELCQCYFEELQVKGFYCQWSQVYGLLSSGRTTGVCVDAGEGAVHAVPCYEGYQIPHALRSSFWAGEDLTAEVLQGLKMRYPAFPADVAVLREIKAALLQVNVSGAQKDAQEAPQNFELPDGFKLNVKAVTLPEAHVIGELLFNVPQGKQGHGRASTQDLVSQAVDSTDADVQGDLRNNVVVVGGTSLVKGFAARLQRELGTGATVNALEDRQQAAFIGASILGSLDTFRTQYISNAEFAEFGTNIAMRKWL